MPCCTSSSTTWITETYTYDGNGFRNSYVDGRSNTTLYCYDIGYSGSATGTRGDLTRVVHPQPITGIAKPTELFLYDSSHNVIQSIPAKGVTSSLTTNCATNLSSSINTNYATTYGYDVTQVFLLSVTTSYTDPDMGLKTSVTKYEYSDTTNPGARTKVIPPRGNTTGTPDYTYATTYTYGTSGSQTGMLVQETSPLGAVTTYQYDAVGRLTSNVDPNGNVGGANPTDHTWQYVYDNEDRIRYTKTPPPVNGGSVLITEDRYDAVGNKTSEIDANGQVTRYIYDVRDNLKETDQTPNTWTDPAVEPTGKIATEYLYDNLGYLTRTTRAKGSSDERVTDYVYDGRGRLTKETEYPSWPTTTPTLVRTYSYDKTDNKTTLVDPLSKTTTYGYDALNRNTTIVYSSTSTPNVTYGFDANGNRTSMVDGTGTTSYTYDEMNRLLSVVSPGSVTVGYRYDVGNNRTKIIYPDTTAVTYAYDKSDRMSTVVDWASRLTSYSYNIDSTVATASNVNNTSANYTYDNAGRVTQVWNKYRTTSTVNRDTYTLDAVGNKLTDDEVLGDSLNTPGPITASRQGTVTNVYDRLYRVTRETRILPNPQSHEQWDYTYDSVGNRTLKKYTDPDHTLITKTTNYSYDKADRILTATGDESETLAINANGNIVTRGIFGDLTITYDQADRMISSNPDFTYTYTYDGDGKLTKVKQGTTVTENNVYDVNRNLPVVLTDGSRKNVWGLTILYNVDNTFNDIHVYHLDELGSMRVITGNDTYGPSIPPYIDGFEEYNAFGVEGWSNRGNDQQYNFTGERKDSATQYVYLRSRFYDPTIARFLSRDTTAGNISSPLSLNRYSYGQDNPVNNVDPTGHSSNKATSTGKVTQKVPRNVDIEAHIREASAWWHRIDPRLNQLWFALQVMPGGPWDYKQGHPEYEDFGNFHYGVVGKAAGFSELTLLAAGGAVQVITNIPRLLTGQQLTPMDFPYLDDRIDSSQISKGYHSR